MDVARVKEIMEEQEGIGGPEWPGDFPAAQHYRFYMKMLYENENAQDDGLPMTRLPPGAFERINKLIDLAIDEREKDKLRRQML